MGKYARERHHHWYLEHREEHLTRNHKRYLTQREDILKKQHEYYLFRESQDHKEKRLRHGVEYRREHKEDYNKQATELREEKRLGILVYYGNNNLACTHCGFDDEGALSIDHIGNNGAAHRKEIGRSRLYNWLIKNGLPEGFQTLCMNCQWIKRREKDEK